MSYSDVEHYASMVSGCESLISGNVKSPNAVYALAVLQLHANDAGLYTGQEGFMDSVKAGAKNVKEWIKKLIQAIRDYFKSKEGKGSAEEAAVIKKVAAAKEIKPEESKDDDKGEVSKPTGESKEDMFKGGWKYFSSAFAQINIKLGSFPDIGDELGNFPNPDKFIKDIEALKETVDNNPGNADPVGDIIDTQNELKAASEKIASLLSAKGDEFIADESNKDLVKAAGRASVTYLECFKAISSAFDRFAARSAEWHDKHKG